MSMTPSSPWPPGLGAEVVVNARTSDVVAEVQKATGGVHGVLVTAVPPGRLAAGGSVPNVVIAPLSMRLTAQYIGQLVPIRWDGRHSSAIASNRAETPMALG
jgi:hypothetical protein